MEIVPKRNKDFCTSYFPCKAWIGPTSGAEKTIKAQSSTPGNRSDYAITVATSDVKGADTDANVYIDLVENEKHTGFLKLIGGQTSFNRGKVS